MRIRQWVLAGVVFMAGLFSAWAGTSAGAQRARMTAWLVGNGYQPELMDERGGPVFVYLDAVNDISSVRWDAARMGRPAPEISDLPDEDDAADILEGWYYTNRLAVAEDGFVQRQVIPPGDALPGGDPAEGIPAWALKYSREAGGYVFRSDESLSELWAGQAEYSNVIERVAAAAALCALVSGLGSGCDTNAAVGDRLFGALGDVYPALVEARSATNVTDSASVWMELYRYQAAGGDMFSDFLLETTNCPYLSIYRE